MGNHSPQYLVNNARGEISKKHLTKTSGLFLTYLHDRPVINYLRSSEQPEFLFKTSAIPQSRSSDGEKFRRIYIRDKNHVYTMITDRRLLFIIGDNIGDFSFELPYEVITAVERSDERGGGIRLQDADGNMYRQSLDIPEPAIEYIRQRISEESIPSTLTAFSGDTFYIVSRTDEGKSSEFCSDARYRIEFSSDIIEFENRTEGRFSVKWERIQSSRLLTHFPSSEFGKYVDGIRLTYVDTASDDRVYLYLLTNKRRGRWGWEHFKQDPTSRCLAMEELSESVERRVREISNVLDSKEHILVESIRKGGWKLRVEGWEKSKDLGESGKIEGSVQSKGKSKGTQVGPFVRSKSKSTGSIDASISLPTSDSTYEKGIDWLRASKEGIYVKTDPILDISYDEIDKIREKDDGFILQTGETGFTIECFRDTGSDISACVRYISEKLESESKTERPVSDDPTAKIREVKELYDDGVISEEEFESKKQELLDKI